MPKFQIGIDEAGRGSLAGPVAVGVVCIPADFDWALIDGVTDSKKLTAKNREAIFCRARELQKEGKLAYAVSMVGPRVIDRAGITKAVQRGIKHGLQSIQKTAQAGRGPTSYKYKVRPHTTKNWHECVAVKLDGLLTAPAEYRHQETIVKGDQKEKVIGLASIMAKVTRDRYMVRLAKKFPNYGFEIHKGYGTEVHRSAIGKYGLCTPHRTTYCTRITGKPNEASSNID